MKKKWTILIIVIISAITGCSDNIKDYKIIQQVALNCLFNYKSEERGILDIRITDKIPGNIKTYELAITNCFFLNKDIICVSSTTKIYFYSIEKDELVKVISFNDEWEKNRKKDKNGWRISVSSYDTIAAKKENNIIFIFCFGKIYEYDFIDDKLKLIYEGFDKLFNFNDKEYVFSNDSAIRGKSAPSYCKSHNSFIFTVQYGDWKSKEIIVWIKEFSLNDHKVRDIVKGWRPYVVESKNALYYISEDESKIMDMDLNTFENKRTLLEFDLPIYYFTPNKAGDKIVFIHRTKGKDIKGSYSHDSKLWYEKDNKIKNFSHDYHLISSDIIFPEDM